MRMIFFLAEEEPAEPASGDSEDDDEADPDEVLALALSFDAVRIFFDGEVFFVGLVLSLEGAFVSGLSESAGPAL
jgi:hypothetical protein